jgi:ABC-type iron transport system FetAB permease component
MLGALGVELYKMVTSAGYLADISNYLHQVLTIVVGLEFVRMLIDTTPASILEVLTVAITRHVILSHDDPWSNLACVACIAGLFAIRRYLIPKKAMKVEVQLVRL